MAHYIKNTLLILLSGLFLFISGLTYSQKPGEPIKTTVIRPYYLSLTHIKTTSLIFPFTIKSVDRGSSDILVQKANGVENILLVKAARESFDETNLSVITADGKFYSFILNYNSNPRVLNILFSEDTIVGKTIPLVQPGNSEMELESMAGRIAKIKRTILGIKNSKYKVQLRLNGIYISNNTLFYQVEIRNRSNIPFDIDMIRFFIRDKRKLTRTASQEIEIEPLHVYGDTLPIKGKSKNLLVFALPKFTIPDKKYLLIQLMEKNGGRHLQLKVQNGTIVNAIRINK